MIHHHGIKHIMGQGEFLETTSMEVLWPFAQMGPIMLTILNLPCSIRNHFGSIILVGIIPANESKEAGNLNPYLEVVVDELLELNSSRLWDAYRNAPFNCKMGSSSICWTILAFAKYSVLWDLVPTVGVHGAIFKVCWCLELFVLLTFLPIGIVIVSKWIPYFNKRQSLTEELWECAYFYGRSPSCVSFHCIGFG